MQLFMQHKFMGRPSRISDQDLADSLRARMLSHDWNSSDVARILNINKATISRALSSNSFSPALRPRVAALIGHMGKDSISELLHKSLHKLRLSDTLRREAEVMISEALDLTRQNQ